MPKMSISQIAALVDSEGLDYAIQHYMGPENVKDARLSVLWQEARDILAEIDSILYPNGIQAYHESDKTEDDDDDVIETDDDE